MASIPEFWIVCELLQSSASDFLHAWVHAGVVDEGPIGFANWLQTAESRKRTSLRSVLGLKPGVKAVRAECGAASARLDRI
jgi:hypothetical protein